MIGMQDNVIQDLKQFIAATVSQQASGLRDDIRADVRDDIRDAIDKLDKKLSQKIDDLSISIGETIDASNEPTESQLKNYEKRITKLEKQAVQ
jgi:hypothetical protein